MTKGIPRKPYLDAKASYRKLGTLDGIESRMVITNGTIGSRLWDISQIESRLSALRMRYKTADVVSRNNLKNEADKLKEKLTRLVNSFELDCLAVADYKMTKQEFVERWRGHYDNGYINQYVVTVDLWTGARYYEQF